MTGSTQSPSPHGFIRTLLLLGAIGFFVGCEAAVGLEKLHTNQENPGSGYYCTASSDCPSTYPYCNTQTGICGSCLVSVGCTGGMTCTQGPSGRSACYILCASSNECPASLTDAGSGDAAGNGSEAPDIQCCSGLCTDTTTDAYNCNNCGGNCIANGFEACVASKCISGSSNTSCGAQGTNCTASGLNQYCDAGTCVCPSGYAAIGANDPVFPASFAGRCKQAIYLTQSTLTPINGLVQCTTDTQEIVYTNGDTFTLTFQDNSARSGFTQVSGISVQANVAHLCANHGTLLSINNIEVLDGFTSWGAEYCACPPTSTASGHFVGDASVLTGYSISGAANTVTVADPFGTINDASTPQIGFGVSQNPVYGYVGYYGVITVAY